MKFILLHTSLIFGYIRYQNVHLPLQAILNFIIQATDSLLNFSTIGALTFLLPFCSLGAEFSLGPNSFRVLSNNSASASSTASNISGIEFTGDFVRVFSIERGLQHVLTMAISWLLFTCNCLQGFFHRVQSSFALHGRFWSIWVSGKLPTYPSPKLTLTLTSH